MDALKYKVYFGGSYREQWSDDYCMTVAYSDRRMVEAVFSQGRWTVAGGDEELCSLLESTGPEDLIQQYFQASATSYAAIHDCLLRDLPLDRLSECLCSRGNPLVGPELMRVLMDDCGMALNTAYQITAHCCDDLRSTGVNMNDMYALQPRTAHVIGILRRTADTELSVAHDSRLALYRSPFGAVECGGALRLAFRLLGGKVEKAELVIYGDEGSESYPMSREGDCYVAQIIAPAEAQALWYRFRIETSMGCHWLCPDNTGYIGRLMGHEGGGFRLTVYERGFDTPEWFRHSVMYQIFPDRFGFSQDDTAARGVAYHKALGQTPELHQSIQEPVRWQPRPFEQSYSPDDFYGGTFKGMEEKLPYLKELGISCLYLNPIVEARSNHRYDTSDYHRPDPILGTMEDFEQLCARAEELGIRLILDGVYSHTGADSRYFNRYGSYPGEGACQSKDSPYYDWYDFQKYPDQYRCWWGFQDLPEVDEENPTWQQDIVTGEDSVVKLWLRHGAAGWRLDVADELPDDVLALIRDAAKSVKPDAPIIGEVWEDAVIKESYGSRRRYALGSSLDSVMNYPFRGSVLAFMHGQIDAYALREFFIAQQMNYPKPMYYSLMNLLGSHDVERLRTALATDVWLRSLSREDQLKVEFTQEALDRALVLERLCAVLQFAIPGVPCIYYGDEQGMCGVNDPFNRQPFMEGDRALHDYYAHLAAQRQAADALSTGEAEFMAANKDLLLILRYINNGLDALGKPAENGAYLAVVNRGETPQRYTADCRAAGCGWVEGCIGPLQGEIIKLR